MSNNQNHSSNKNYQDNQGDVMTPIQISEELCADYSSVMAFLHRGKLEGAFKKGYQWFVPKRVVMDIKKKYFSIEKSLDKYIKLDEASTILEIHIEKLYRLIKRKELNAIRYGFKQYYLLLRDEVYAYKQKNESSSIVKKNLSDYFTAPETSKILSLDHSTLIDHLNNQRFEGATIYNNRWYLPKKSVKEIKQKYFSIDNVGDYMKIREASKILGLSVDSVQTLIESEKVDLNGQRYSFQQYYLIQKDAVYAFKQFLDAIPYDYYTVDQLVEKYNCSRKYVIDTFFNKEGNVKWALINKRQLGMFIKKDIVEDILKNGDFFRLLKPNDPISIFNISVSHLKIPETLKETSELFFQFFDSKTNFSSASLKVKRMVARQFTVLYEELMSLLSKDIHLYSDSEIKLLFKKIDRVNSKKHLTHFLMYCQEQLPKCAFSEAYRVVAKSNKRSNEKDIYTKSEFGDCYLFVKDIERHIDKALVDRRYAVTWLYVSLHFTNAWRSGDFIRLPSVRIDVIKVNSLDWFAKGNRLSQEQAQRILNQYASKRLVVSKTGAMNRFLVNLDMLIPLATMIVICELHRLTAKDMHLISLGTRHNEFKNTVKEFFSTYPFAFSSRKMNRTFMSYLFYAATKNMDHMGLALELTQRTRAHKNKDTTTLYIQSTNQDGPIDDISVQLCNRGHFGYLYNLLIEAEASLENRDKKNKRNDLMERTLQIQQWRKLIPTPYQLESFGSFLQEQYDQRDSIAVRIAQMPKEEIRGKLKKIYLDEMPGHTEHAQCFTYPNCIYPNASSCIGCLNMIPKNYILISLYQEIYNRLKMINDTKYLAVGEREKVWIYKFLYLLQEAVDTFGKEYVEAFMDLDELLKQVAVSFERLDYLHSNISKLEEENE